MRHFILAGCFAFFLTGCQKSLRPSNLLFSYPALKQSLADSLRPVDFHNLDLSRVFRSSYGNLNLLRVKFIDRPLASSFVLVEVDNFGHIRRGRIIELSRKFNLLTFNGTLTIKTLQGETQSQSIISNGYRIASPATRADIIPAPADALPEVIVVGHYPNFNIDPGAWYNLPSFMNDGSGTSSDTYVSGGGGSAASGPSNAMNSPGYGDIGASINASGETVIEADFEELMSKAAIDLEKFISCFGTIPDNGAACTLTIYADVPVNADPSLIMDWNTGFPGHSWVQLEKKFNGRQISQQIGFYPASAWKTVTTNAPLSAKFVDDGNHEFNAAYTINITPARLQSALTRMRQLANARYDIDDFNCTDWTLEIWRSAADPDLWLDLARFQMPGSLSPAGTNTPQGLYEKISDLQKAGTPGATIPNIGWSGNSTGPCN